MILTPDIQQTIVDEITAHPERAVILPDWAYTPEGRCIVQVDGLNMDLHRHLHELLIRPLGYHERMWQQGPKRNVNPHLFEVVEGTKSPRTHCSKGHAYEGNEAPPNSRGYRCRTCLKESRRVDGATTPNKLKTHCPHGHKYTRKNTIRERGRRRCRTCKTTQNAAYMRRRREENQ